MSRIKSLEGLRVIALIIIVLSHFEFIGYINNSAGLFYNKYLHNATLGVDFFFLISGFGMMLSSFNKEKEKVTLFNSIRFAIKKVSRLYLLVLLTFIPGVIILFEAYFGGEFSYNKLFEFISIIVFAPTLLQSATGLTIYSHALNGVVWFLSTLFIIYLFSPLIMRIFRKKISNLKIVSLFLVLSFLCIIGLTYLFSYIEKISSFDNLSYGSPYIRIFYVIIGMLLAYIYIYIRERNEEIIIVNKNLFSMFEVSVIIIGLTWFLLRNSVKYDLYLLRIIDVPLISLILLVFSFNKGIISSILSSKFFMIQVKYVPYAFLIHYSIRATIDNYVLKYYELNNIIVIIFVVAIIFGTIILSIGYSFLSNKIRNGFKKGRKD